MIKQQGYVINANDLIKTFVKLIKSPEVSNIDRLNCEAPLFVSATATAIEVAATLNAFSFLSVEQNNERVFKSLPNQ